LTAGLQSCCTLIAAPAGWGKTLLAGSWLAEGGADRAAAWVSLGPADDDVRTLWTAVAIAIAPVIGERAAADLRQVVTDDDVENMPGRVAAALADDGTPVVLVLDNLHEIDRAVGTRPGDPHAVTAVRSALIPLIVVLRSSSRTRPSARRPADGDALEAHVLRSAEQQARTIAQRRAHPCAGESFGACTSRLRVARRHPGPSHLPVCLVSLGWLEHIGRRTPACGDPSQYADSITGVVGLHRRRRRPRVLRGDTNAQHAAPDPEADRWSEYDGLAVDSQRDRLCGVDLEYGCRPLSQ
jgi:hypothetical protein